MQRFVFTLSIAFSHNAMKIHTIKARYNSYIHASTITHHVHAEAAAWSESGNKVCTINDDTALLHLLSGQLPI